ncbi:MAG: hypothetical protein M1812_001237 [Candelaria pacifica]|nr:MAG: hypothetical protein M1812_001237 [Candelaria pacifica]
MAPRQPFTQRLLRLAICAQWPLSGLGQYSPNTEVVTVNNVVSTVWSASLGAPTISVTAVASIPTMAYNCRNVPALCANVQQNYAQYGIPNHQGNGVAEFVYDPSSKKGGRNSKRRKRRCPDDWKNEKLPDPNVPGGTRPRCPELNQPDISPPGVARSPPHVDPDGPPFVIEGVEDANGESQLSGLIMTCDEFPPAMYEVPFLASQRRQENFH